MRADTLLCFHTLLSYHGWILKSRNFFIFPIRQKLYADKLFHPHRVSPVCIRIYRELLLAHETAAAGFAHAAGVVTVNVDRACHALAMIVGFAAHGVAAHTDIRASAARICAGHAVRHGIFSLHEALAAGFIGAGCAASAHLDISLGTQFSFVIDTGHSRTF